MISEPYAPPSAPLGSSPGAPPSKPRRWWLAGLLGLAAPGLGQIYVGKAAQGIAGFFFLLILIPVCRVLRDGALPPPLTFALSLLPVALYLCLWADAVYAARRLGSAYPLKKYNRWYVYLAYVLLVASIVPGGFFVHAFYVPAGSMEPTILVGDHLYVHKGLSWIGDPERGDIVVLASPEQPDVLIMKRVVGLPGDRLEIRNKELHLNGERQSEPYVVHGDPILYSPDSFNEQARQRDQTSAVVPPGHYYLLGDNRDFSYDSRFFGPVERESIKSGGGIVIYWSRDPETKETRWDRIGQIVD